MDPSISRYAGLALLVPFFAGLAAAKSNTTWCGSYPGQAHEELDLHRKSLRGGKFKAATSRPAARLAGDILILEDADGVVARRNPFNLLNRSVTFSPAPTGYRFATTPTPPSALDPVALGEPLSGLGDDDTREVDLPFPFRFYGTAYTKLHINSDGNLTFGAGDVDTSARSLGRFNAGPPRIAGLFADLDPSASGEGVRILRSPARFTVTWLRVREYSDFGFGQPQTFQITLTPDGAVTLSWAQVNIANAVIGITPGGLTAASAIVSFNDGSDRTYPGAVAESFGNSTAVDLVTASQKVYASQDDAFDYLAFFNNSGIAANSGVIAFEITVRARRQGIGDSLLDSGREYGSANRLQAVLNLGPLTQYPEDPNAPMPSRASTGDTGLTLVAHEAGHLFLAFASNREGSNRPLLGRQTAHWAFTFNSEASLLEGNRIEDAGEAATPRFRTVATVEGFSPLDQYLMGLRPPAEVPPTFYVQNSGLSPTLTAPRVGATFNGTRRNIGVEELIAAEGRRIPDHTVEQRRYRIGFVLIVPAGSTPTAQELAKVDLYRREIEAAWPRYSGGRASLDTSFRRNLRLSVEPAAGLLAGRSATATLSLDRPRPTPLTVTLRTASGHVTTPAAVLIPAGQTTAPVELSALRPGVDTLYAEGPDEFTPVEARVQVLPASGAGLSLVPVSSPGAAPVFRAQDSNELPYPGLPLAAGSTIVATNSSGLAIFPPGTQQVTLPGTTITGIVDRSPALSPNGVVNAASFRPGIVPGGIATAFGANLRGAQLTIDGSPVVVFFSNDTQANFAVPTGLTRPTAEITASNTAGRAALAVPVLAAQPGIFFDAASGRAAAIPRGSGVYEVYGTGFGRGAVAARSGARPLEVLFSGAAPGFIGLQQINIRGGSPGEALTLSVDGVESNTAGLP
jgi:uncharacterized protein (TIGR03437 family)